MDKGALNMKKKGIAVIALPGDVPQHSVSVFTSVSVSKTKRDLLFYFIIDLCLYCF